jgi:hypothetical protein
MVKRNRGPTPPPNAPPNWREGTVREYPRRRARKVKAVKRGKEARWVRHAVVRLIDLRMPDSFTGLHGVSARRVHTEVARTKAARLAPLSFSAVCRLMKLHGFLGYKSQGHLPKRQRTYPAAEK